MQFYLFRHGQSQNNLLHDLTGSWRGGPVDPRLTPEGERQARLLGEHLQCTDPQAPTRGDMDAHNLRGFGLTHLYTSLMMRAAATAEIIAGQLGMPVTAREDLFEAGGLVQEDPQTGERQPAPGASRIVLEQEFPHIILPAWVDEKGWYRRPVETWSERIQRAAGLLLDLQAVHQPEDRVGLVTHGEFIYHLVHALLGFSALEGTWIHLNNTSITRIDILDSRRALIYLNRVNHLPPELIT